MIAATVNGSGSRPRSGAQVLTLLAAAPNAEILRALALGSKRMLELRQETGLAAQSTVRTQLKRLGKQGAVEQGRRNRFPGVLEYELTEAGWDLLLVLGALERWLEAPDSVAAPLGGRAARAAVKALTEAWSTTMLRALAGGPLSLTGLDPVIASLSYPALERRLGALRLAGLTEPAPGSGREKPFAPTRGLRLAVAPLAAAAHWEGLHRPETAPPLRPLDAETLLLLAAQLLKPSQVAQGTCQLIVEIAGREDRGTGSVTVELRAGRGATSSTVQNDHPDAWARGRSQAWLAMLSGVGVGDIELGGDPELAQVVMGGLRAALGANREVTP